MSKRKPLWVQGKDGYWYRKVLLGKLALEVQAALQSSPNSPDEWWIARLQVGAHYFMLQDRRERGLGATSLRLIQRQAARWLNAPKLEDRVRVLLRERAHGLRLDAHAAQMELQRCEAAEEFLSRILNAL